MNLKKNESDKKDSREADQSAANFAFLLERVVEQAKGKKKKV